MAAVKSDRVVKEHMEGVEGKGSTVAGTRSDSFSFIMSLVRLVHAEGGGLNEGCVSMDARNGTALGLTLRSAFCAALLPRRRSPSLCGQETVLEAFR